MPFKGSDAMTRMISVAMDSPRAARELNPEIPPEFAELIAQLLEKDPSRRPKSAEEVADRLAEIANDLRSRQGAAAGVSELLAEHSARHLVDGPRTGRPRRRFWAFAAAAAGVLIVAMSLWNWTNAGTLEIQTDEEGVRLVLSRGGQVVQTVEGASTHSLRLRSGDYKLDVESNSGTPGDLVLSTDRGTNEFHIDRGDTVVATVRRSSPSIEPVTLRPVDREPAHVLEELAVKVPFRSLPGSGSGADVRCLSFTADGRFLLVGHRSRLSTYDAASLRRTEFLPLHTSPSEAKNTMPMAVSHDGRLLATTTAAGKLALWDVHARKERGVLAQTGFFSALEFSPDGARLVVGDGKFARIFDTESLKELQSLPGHPDTVSALAFALSEKKLAVGCVDGSLWLWDLIKHKHENLALPSPRSEIVNLVYAKGGKRIIVGRPHDVRVVHPGAIRESNKLNGQGGAVTMSRDSRWIAFGDGRRLVLFEPGNGKRHSLPPEHSEPLAHIAFAPDGRSVATASRDGSVKLWDISSIVDLPISIFNGRDLKGWSAHNCPADAFTVAEGELVATGKDPGWLVTEEAFDNFELKLEYRLAPGGRSGIAAHAAPDSATFAVLEIPLVDDEHMQSATSSSDARPEQRTGALGSLVSPSLLNNNKIGEWNQLRLVLEGRHVVIEINGLRVVEYTITSTDMTKNPALARATGRVALQSQNGRTEFRNILVKHLMPANKQ
jgi:WD40 repeat protein